MRVPISTVSAYSYTYIAYSSSRPRHTYVASFVNMIVYHIHVGHDLQVRNVTLSQHSKRIIYCLKRHLSPQAACHVRYAQKL